MNRIINIGYGNMVENGRLILSALLPETIASRINNDISKGDCYEQ